MADMRGYRPPPPPPPRRSYVEHLEQLVDKAWEVAYKAHEHAVAHVAVKANGKPAEKDVQDAIGRLELAKEQLNLAGGILSGIDNGDAGKAGEPMDPDDA